MFVFLKGDKRSDMATEMIMLVCYNVKMESIGDRLVNGYTIYDEDIQKATSNYMLHLFIESEMEGVCY